MKNKICSSCREEKPVNKFWKRKDRCRHLYRSNCIDCIYKAKNKYKKENPDKVFEQHRKYVSKYSSKKSSKKRAKLRERKRYKTDIQFKLRKILRSRLRCAILDQARVGSAVRDLGCSIEELKTHIENQFEKGMSWDNWSHSVWHIDHISPLSRFDLTNEDQFKQACHFTNLRPMWATDNLRKHNKINWNKDE